MFGLPEGNGLMAFSDTAGANACLSLAFMLVKEGREVPSLCTNNPGFIKNDWGLEVRFAENIEQIPESISANYVFTGTSHPDSSKGFELGFIRLAKQQKIHSISFIDHWVNFRRRFEVNNETFFPDEIWILDEKAKEAAITEGLPKDKLVIHENPQHVYLAKYWEPHFRGHGYLHQLGIATTPATKVVLYAPDPVSLRFKNNELGFDETSALELLINILSEMAKQLTILLIIKPHPLQIEGKLEGSISFISNKNIRCEIIKKANNAELINCADVVVGFYSNFLLEAQQLNKPVIRYFPGPASVDPFDHLKKRLPVVDGASLFSSLNACLKEYE